MELGSTLDIIKKYGINSLMAIAIIWMNNRLNKFEDRLYDCYDDKEDILKNKQLSNKNNNKSILFIKHISYAILPKENKSIEIYSDRKES